MSNILDSLIQKLVDTDDVSAILEIRKDIKNFLYPGTAIESYLCDNDPVGFGSILKRFDSLESGIRELFHTTDYESRYNLVETLKTAKLFLSTYKEGIPCSFYNDMFKFISLHEKEGMAVWKETGLSPLKNPEFFSKVHEESKIFRFIGNDLKKALLSINSSITFSSEENLFLYNGGSSFKTDTKSVINFLSTAIADVENLEVELNYDRNKGAIILYFDKYSDNADFSLLRGVCEYEYDTDIDGEGLSLFFY